MSTFAHVVIHPEQLAAFFRSQDGPVFRMLLEDGEAVKDEAKRRVGVYQGNDPRRTRRPGTLRDSIVKRMVVDNGLPAVEVGSDDPIALIHHEGRPGITGNPLLVFWDGRNGHVVAVRSVGPAEPNRYLVDSLAVLRSRH